jgi:hypothetical protein
VGENVDHVDGIICSSLLYNSQLPAPAASNTPKV